MLCSSFTEIGPKTSVVSFEVLVKHKTNIYHFAGLNDHNHCKTRTNKKELDRHSVIGSPEQQIFGQLL